MDIKLKEDQIRELELKVQVSLFISFSSIKNDNSFCFYVFCMNILPIILSECVYLTPATDINLLL